MIWESGLFKDIYFFLQRDDNFANVTRCIYKFDHYIEMYFARFHSISPGYAFPVPQVVIIQELFPDKVVDFASLLDETTSLYAPPQPSASVVCFPLDPKPREAVLLCEWVRDCWQGNQFRDTDVSVLEEVLHQEHVALQELKRP